MGLVKAQCNKTCEGNNTSKMCPESHAGEGPCWVHPGCWWVLTGEAEEAGGQEWPC